MNEIMKCGESLVEKLGENECSLEKVEAKTEDEGKEKHVPVVEKAGSGIKVRVGSVPHPMEEGHHIEWIEVVSGSMIYRKSLRAGEAPEAEFPVEEGSVDLVREHCNIHGLWKKQ